MDEAAESLKEAALQAAALPASLQWRLVAWLRAAGELECATVALDAIEARLGVTAKVLEERARLAFAAGDRQAARRLIEERAHRFPSLPAWLALARCYVEIGNLADAEAIAQRLVREDSSQPSVCLLAGDVARANGAWEVARGFYLSALDAKPDNSPALLALARLALDEGDREAAAAFARRAARAAEVESSAGICAALAEILDQLGAGLEAAAWRKRQQALLAERTTKLAADVRAALASSSERRSKERRARRQELPEPEAEDGVAESVLANAALPARNLSDVSVEPRVLTALRELFGYRSLRPGQAEVIRSVLQRRDTLALMPTGAGKSLTFQLPAMLLPGTTVVISPLIALMKDQVESLPPAVRERTATINSALSLEELRERIEQLRGGQLKLIYIAPERLRDHRFLAALREAGTALVVIDEAHCISLWGHDFRPDYLAIPRALAELGNPPLLAITATATPAMVKEIGAGLGRQLSVVRISLFRPNLFYEVHRLANREQKVAKVIEICRAERGAGIVYVSSRKDAESIAGILRDNRVAAIPYHAGLSPEVRTANQERFMRGQVRVVVATVAFGMGVDKGDVRFIVHLIPPDSLEAYAQESGRAGRDGRPARCVLLVAPADEATLKRRARQDELDLDTLRRIYTGIKRAGKGRWALIERLQDLVGTDDDADDEVTHRVALALLEQAELIARHPDAPLTFTLRWRSDSPVDAERTDATWARFLDWLGPDAGQRGAAVVRTDEACDALDLSPADLVALWESQPDVVARGSGRAMCFEVREAGPDSAARLNELLAKARRDAERRIASMLRYVNDGRCRHVLLAAHLGERLSPCGTACDVCTGAAIRQAVSGSETRSRRDALTGEDALTVLTAMRTLPFPLGVSGLTKLLTGSVESRIRADRSDAFGALRDVPKSKVQALIERLVADGFLALDARRDLPVLQLTERGAQATATDLASVVSGMAPRATSRSAPATRQVSTAAEETELSDADQALLNRLVAWRRETANAEGVPPYVVAHNSMLRNLAVSRPATLSALAAVPGFGQTRVERYGRELLRLIADEGTA